VIRLQNEGLLEIVPRHGVRIVPIAVSDMREIYDVLISLESRAAELLAARGASPKELRQLEDACARMADSLTRGEMEEWALADEEFHLGIVQLSSNRRLVDIVLNCWDQVHRARYFTLRLRQHPQPSKSIEEHYEIIEAVRRGDASAAYQIYRRHRERGLKEQIDVMTAFRIHQI
jgi:DNA-binding GntR family transcriptional regulator